MPTIGESDERVNAYAELPSGTGVRLLWATARAPTRPTTAWRAIYRELRQEGQRERLLSLLHHAEVAVRIWAAAHALEFAPDEASTS